MDNSDAALVALFRERNEDALAETKARYGAYCTKIASDILGSPADAEECVSDTLLAAWNTIPPAHPEHLRLYLARIVRNLALNRYERIHAEKRGGGEVPFLLSELADCIPSSDGSADEPTADAEPNELRLLLDRFVKELPARERTVFVKRYFYSISVSEIAHSAGLRENHVSVILSRTREKLKKLLAEEGYSV